MATSPVFGNIIQARTSVTAVNASMSPSSPRTAGTPQGGVISSRANHSGAPLVWWRNDLPARLGLDDRALLTLWKEAYKRGTAMQAPLAIIGFLLGLAAWWQTGHWAWLLGAAILIANWPVYRRCRVRLPESRRGDRQPSQSRQRGRLVMLDDNSRRVSDGALYEGFVNATFFEEQRREMVAAIRAIAEHLAPQIGKTALDERVLRAMAKVGIRKPHPGLRSRLG
jgi:Domain of unknown function (DUF1772)